MNLLNPIINSLWFSFSYNHHRSFTNNIPRARQVQLKILQNNINKNRNTVFGKDHSFSRINSVEQFQAQVPLLEYEDYLPWIERMAAGEKNILTSEPLILFEPTGGSSTGSKLIPYTSSLRADFQRAIGTWVFDIFKNYPRILKGKSYWSVSPAAHNEEFTSAGIPIGFSDDTSYLGFFGKILNHVFAVPGQISSLSDIESHRFMTAFLMLAEKHLALISVWHPTFLLILLDYIQAEKDNLIRALYDGQVNGTTSTDNTFVQEYLKPNPKRVKELERIFEYHTDSLYEKIWPGLQLISCWTEASSAHYSDLLKKLFPNTHIQGKGLLATEGIVSIPFIKAGGNLPAYTSHFLEFYDQQNRAIYLVDELQQGRSYSVVLTSSGGLYRYQLKDIVKVTGHYSGLPLLQFEGRQQASDLVGEKLEETHVLYALDKVLKQFKIKTKFFMLAPQREENSNGYVLFIEPENRLKQPALILNLIEEELNENYHYAYARKLNQLKPLKLFIVNKNGMQTYQERCMQAGQKQGDIKPTFLDRRVGWVSYFDGAFLSNE